jgi:hypothetical protein
MAVARDQAERHRGIEVTAGDVPDRVRHRHDRETERERHAHEANTEIRIRPAERCREHGTAAPSEHQPERPERFRDEFLGHALLSSTPRRATPGSIVPSLAGAASFSPLRSSASARSE